MMKYQKPDAVVLQEEYEHNKEFNAYLDNELDETEFQVLLNGLDVSDHPIASISKALFYGDTPKYQALLASYYAKLLDNALSKDSFPELASRLENRFKQLKRTIHNKKVAVFIGAGVPASIGFPTWKPYLEQLASESGMSQDKVCALLETSDYFSAAEQIIAALGLERFELGFNQDFSSKSDSSDLYASIFKIPNAVTITTNYDCSLEDYCNRKGQAYELIKRGASIHDGLLKKMQQNSKILLKIHGCVNEPSTRIFKKTEYDEYYGLHLRDNKPLPLVLTRLYSHFPFFFIGSSLIEDHLLTYFKETTVKLGVTQIPEHFAIVEAPAEEERIQGREQFLCELGIQPIWYPFGEHEKVHEILGLLLDDHL